MQVRLNFLSTLLEQSYSLLSNSLCASLLGRKVFVLPFHRDVEMTEKRARAMLACLNHCKRVSVLIVHHHLKTCASTLVAVF
jgi:hypothetical protein